MNSEPTVQTADIDLLAWFEVNKKRLAQVGAVVLVVGFGAWTYHTMSLQKEARASADLLKLQMSTSLADEPTSPPASAYTEIMQRHQGARAAERALLLAGEAAFTEQKYADAQGFFERFVKEHPDSAHISTAAYGVAASLEAQNKLTEAMTAYQDVVTRYAGLPIVTQAKLSLARLNELSKKPADALKIYEELAAVGAASSWATEVASRKEALLSRNPDLAALAAPKASPSTNAVPAVLSAPAATAKPAK